MMRLGQRGVSLMEAVVALAVMGFGMLGVAAMQSSLRQNADLARQRAEAVRLAQDAIERNRSYSVIATTALKQAYDDIPVADSNNTFSGTNRNASYTRAVAAAASAPFNLTTVKATVTWTDRANNTQSVLLASQIHRVPPELAGSLIVDGSRTVPQLRGGSSQVPPGWRDNGDGSFSPPVTNGASPHHYVFGANGVATQTIGPCASATPSNCLFRVVQGYVAFATSGVPTESPIDNAPPGVVSMSPTPPPVPPAPSLVSVAQDHPNSPPTHLCYYERIGASPLLVKTVTYNCLIGVTSTLPESPNSRWSARLELFFSELAPSNDVASSSNYRVCRYTRYRNNNIPSAHVVEADGLVISNIDHPRKYESVAENLVNQNYLVIRGNAGTVDDYFGCPDDDPSTPVFGRTFPHQPAYP